MTNQQSQDLFIDALDLVNLTIEHIGGLEALFKSIYLQSKGIPELREILNAAKLGCYVCMEHQNTLDCEKKALTTALNKSLESGGNSHE